MTENACFEVTDLLRLASEILVAHGVPEQHARLTALTLISADQRGINSHGLLRLPLYADALRLGGINAQPSMTWTRGEGNVAMLNADAALGQVAMQAAVDYVLEQGSRSGIAAVAVSNSSHYGAGAFWSDQLADAGFLSILTSTTGPVVAPHGGAEKVLGTNPLTMGMPSSGEWPLTADIATSNGAYGKVIAARNEGRALPEGWAVDVNGQPTTDPVAAAEGSMIPFGAHKGSAVSALIEAFSGALGDATYAFETVDIWTNPASQMNNGHLLIGLDVGALTGRQHTESRVHDLQERIRNSGRVGQTVHSPGDPERLRQKENASAVPLSPTTARQLTELAHRLGITPSEEIQNPTTASNQRNEP